LQTNLLKHFYYNYGPKHKLGTVILAPLLNTLSYPIKLDLIHLVASDSVPQEVRNILVQ